MDKDFKDDKNSSGMTTLSRDKKFYYLGSSTRVGRISSTFGKYLPSIKRGCILDLGCSYGYTTVDLAKEYPGCAVIGIDKEERRVQRAYANCRAMMHDISQLPGRVTFQVADGYFLDKEFPHKKFHAIFAMNNIMFMADLMDDQQLVTVLMSLEDALVTRGHLLLSKARAWIHLQRTSSRLRVIGKNETEEYDDKEINRIKELLSNKNYRTLIAGLSGKPFFALESLAEESRIFTGQRYPF